MLRDMAREPVDHPERKCANPECPVVFKPIRATQVFHSPDCRKVHWSKAYHWTAHPCPLCTVVHDPEEAPVLDALERLLKDSRPLDVENILTDAVEDFIARRRAILRGESVAGVVT